MLALVVVGGLGLQRAWADGDLNTLVCGGPCGPEAVAAPADLGRDGAAVRAEPQAQVAGTLDPQAVRAALEPLLGASALGDRVGVSVLDPTGATVLEVAADRPFVPASTTKLVTAYAALDLLDPQSRFTTSVVRDGDRVVLVGGGDPYLAARAPEEPTAVDRADLATLAERTAAALRGSGAGSVTLGYDASLFTGPAASPEWEDDYVSGQVVTPVSALWVDRGETDGVRSADPAASAAARFAVLLREEGVEVRGEPTSAEAPAAATTLAEVESATVAQVVDAVLVRSDNEAAEVLLRQVAIAAGEPASFDGGAAAVRSVLEDAQVPLPGFEVFDGSGLSRSNRISPATLTGLVRAAATRADTAEILAALPVGGLTGTLDDRLEEAGAGVVRAKTGTLTGVHSLAGYVTDVRGVPLAFAVMTDGSEGDNPLETQAALDDLATALATCDCS